MRVSYGLATDMVTACHDRHWRSQKSVAAKAHKKAAPEGAADFVML
jgi:hypothetical protein